MLRATADVPELYLAVEVPGDYAELRRRVMSGKFLVEGTLNRLYFAPRFWSHYDLPSLPFVGESLLFNCWFRF